MKKLLILSLIMMIVSLVMINTANASFSVGMSMEANQKEISVGDEETLILSFNENIIASNFEISYDKDVFELIGSNTNNLSVAEKNEKIACIYADISGNGTKKMSIKFKAKKETKSSSFLIENAKFRAEGQEKSYTGNQILGLDKALEVKVSKVTEKDETNDGNVVGNNTVADNENATKNNTIAGNNTIVSNNNTSKNNTIQNNEINGKDTTVVASNKLPKAGKDTGYILLISSIALSISSIVFWKKAKELDKIFSSISIILLAMVITTSMSTKVYGASELTLIYNDNLIGNKKVLGIMPNNDYNRNAVLTKQKLLTQNTNISSVLDKTTRTEKGINDFVGTGDIAVINNDEYSIVLYGDANGDGIICDTDDMMVIINDYLGINTAQDEYRLAANLQNSDSILDTDDLMQMIDMYLGRLNNSLVTNLPENHITIQNDIQVQFKDVSSGSFVVDYSGIFSNSTDDAIPTFGSNGNQIRDGYFDAKIELSSNTSYEIQYEYVNNMSELDCLRRDAMIDYETFGQLELNKWTKYSNPLRTVGKFECHQLHNSNTFDKDFMKFRLYDSNTDKYSEEKTITIRNFIESLGFTIISQ